MSSEMQRDSRRAHGRRIYMDASCVLRLLLGEPGVRAPLGRNVRAASSQLVEVECSRALDRARLHGLLDDREIARKLNELARVIDRLNLIPVSEEVIALARATFPVAVRALDALHVASAQWLTSHVSELEFWTHDDRQATAALARGLDMRGVADPGP